MVYCVAAVNRTGVPCYIDCFRQVIAAATWCGCVTYIDHIKY